MDFFSLSFFLFCFTRGYISGPSYLFCCVDVWNLVKNAKKTHSSSIGALFILILSPLVALMSSKSLLFCFIGPIIALILLVIPLISLIITHIMPSVIALWPPWGPFLLVISRYLIYFICYLLVVAYLSSFLNLVAYLSVSLLISLCLIAYLLFISQCLRYRPTFVFIILFIHYNIRYKRPQASLRLSFMRGLSAPSYSPESKKEARGFAPVFFLFILVSGNLGLTALSYPHR